MPGGFDMANGCELIDVGPLASNLSAFIISTIILFRENKFSSVLDPFLQFASTVLDYFHFALHVICSFQRLSLDVSSLSPPLSLHDLGTKTRKNRIDQLLGTFLHAQSVGNFRRRNFLCGWLEGGALI